MSIIVSIPFIAGQWSLRCGVGSMPTPYQVSIPFIAGQWSLPSYVNRVLESVLSQSPSLRGSGRFERQAAQSYYGVLQVSIPFIAGQWSLPLSDIETHQETLVCLNPLHCGAVVASTWTSRADGGSSSSLNPLHCGAVVASPRTWTSLRGGGSCLNPLHCGAVVASHARRMAGGGSAGSLNPLHCGAVVASRGRRGPVRRRAARVSIPFIAGQWSLQARPGVGRPVTTLVSIPFIAGQWSLRRNAPLPRRGEGDVSIPFIAGQWSLRDDLAEERVDIVKSQSPSLRGSGRFEAAARAEAEERARRLNPLHCGAVVASPSHNALPVLPRPAAEEATSVRPRSLRAIARLAETRYHSLTRAVYQVIPRRSSMNRWSLWLADAPAALCAAARSAPLAAAAVADRR